MASVRIWNWTSYVSAATAGFLALTFGFRKVGQGGVELIEQGAVLRGIGVGEGLQAAGEIRDVARGDAAVGGALLFFHRGIDLLRHVAKARDVLLLLRGEFPGGNASGQYVQHINDAA